MLLYHTLEYWGFLLPGKPKNTHQVCLTRPCIDRAVVFIHVFTYGIFINVRACSKFFSSLLHYTYRSAQHCSKRTIAPATPTHSMYCWNCFNEFLLFTANSNVINKSLMFLLNTLKCRYRDNLMWPNLINIHELSLCHVMTSQLAHPWLRCCTFICFSLS